MKTVDYNIICEENKDMNYIDLYWMKESDYAATNLKDGNAYGAYGFDRRHSLVQFMKYCIEYDAVGYEDFKEFIAFGSGSPKLQNNEDLAVIWNRLATDPMFGTEFMDLQNRYAYEHYYLLAVSNCVKAGLDIDSPKYTSVLRGTLWFFITKFGISSGTKKVLAPFKQGVTDELEALHMIFTASTSVDKEIYDKAIELYNIHTTEVNLDFEPGKETIEKIKAIDVDGDDEFEESPIMPEETVISKTPGETKETIELGYLDPKFTGPVSEPKHSSEFAKAIGVDHTIEAINKSFEMFGTSETDPVSPKENRISKDHIDVKVVDKTPTSEDINNHLMFDNARDKAKKDFNKKAEFKVCENWNHGYPVNLKYASQYYDEAKEEAIKIATNTRKVMYVYGNKGQRLFMYDPKKSFPKTVNGYKVGTGIIGSTIKDELGAFNTFDIAKRWADMNTQTSKKIHRVYLNQECIYTSNVKVK